MDWYEPRRRPCGCPWEDRHNWNCTLTPIYAQTYWDTDPTPIMLRAEAC